jgi:hypothetical protein
VYPEITMCHPATKYSSGYNEKIFQEGPEIVDVKIV